MNNYSIDNINERFNNEAVRWKNLYKRRNNFFTHTMINYIENSTL